MDEDVDMARGVPQSFYVDEFAAEGIMFEGVAGPPDLHGDVAAADRRRATRGRWPSYRRAGEFG